MECDKNNLPTFVKEWKNDICEKTRSFNNNVVIFSHFMVINALLSELAKIDKLLYFFPDYTSVVKVILNDKRFEYFLTEGGKKTSIKNTQQQKGVPKNPDQSLNARRPLNIN